MLSCARCGLGSLTPLTRRKHYKDGCTASTTADTKQKIAQAVVSEDYETAAALKDQLLAQQAPVAPAAAEGPQAHLQSARSMVEAVMKHSDIQIMAAPLRMAKSVPRVFDGPNADVDAMRNMSSLGQLPLQWLAAAMCNSSTRLHRELPLASLLWELLMMTPAASEREKMTRIAIRDKRIANGLRSFMQGADAAMKRAIVTTTVRADATPGLCWMMTRELVVERAQKLDATLLRSMHQMIQMLCASHIIIKSHDNGFFANWLQVLDVLVHVDPHVSITVDWTVSGDEKHFTFGEQGTNLWDFLYDRFSHSCTPADLSGNNSFTCVSRFNPFFYSCYRRLLFEESCSSEVRQVYHRASRRIRIKHPRVMQLVAENQELFGASYAIAVHKRVHTPGVVDNQSEYSMPSLQDYITRCVQVVAAAESKIHDPVVLYLATDDLTAVPAFKQQFGDRLIVRSDVKRTTGGLQENGQQNEVHMIAGNATEQEAIDVVVDVETMALCNELVHIDSNVSTAVAIINPSIVTHHVMALPNT